MRSRVLVLLLTCSAAAACKANSEIRAHSHAHLPPSFIGVLIADLWHVDSSPSPWAQTQHWVARALERNTARLRSLGTARKPPRDLAPPLDGKEEEALAAVDPDGTTQNPQGSVSPSQVSYSYYMSLSVGNPPKPTSMLVDTGSSLIWLNCDPCDNCYNPNVSSSHQWLPCSSGSCVPPYGQQDPACTDEGRCVYHQAYADNSVSDGVMIEETFVLDATNISNVLFGCSFNTQNPAALEVQHMSGGILGLGASFLSLPSQVSKPLFFCLPVLQENGSAAAPGFLGIGNYTDLPSSPIVTQLKRSTIYDEFYYVPLTGMSVNGVPVALTPSDILLQDDGTKGTMIDTGTSFTSLIGNAYDDLKGAFSAAATQLLPADPVQGFDTCFRFNQTLFDPKAIPVLDFQFQGGGTWTILPTGTLIAAGNGVYCFAFQPQLGDEQDFNVIGNTQLAGTTFVIDKSQASITIAPNANC